MKKWALPLLALFFFLFLILPLGTLLQGAFRVQSPGDQGQGHWSLEYFQLTLANPFFQRCLINSLEIAVATTLGCLTVALPFAWLLQRYSFPGRPWLERLFLLPLILPPFVGAIGIKQLFSRFGSVNLAFSHLGWLDPRHPVDWLGQSGLWGVVLLEVLHLFPILFLGLQASLSSVDPSLREAARNQGSSRWSVFRRVTLPLAWPGVYASGSIVFISAFTDLGVPLMFNYTATVPTQIFNLVTQTNNPQGYALVLLTLALVAGLFSLGLKWGDGSPMMARGNAGEEQSPLSGPARVLAPLAMGLWISLSILPHLGIVLASLADRWFLTVLPSSWTLAHYHEVLSLPLTQHALRNSLVYASGSCVLDIFLGVVIAYLLARETFPGKSVLNVLAMLPLALPGVVSAFAYFTTFSRAPFPVAWSSLNHGWLACFDPRQNPTVILILAYALHRLPYIVRQAYAGLQQNSPALEEASRNLGAGFIRTLACITLPVIATHVLAAALLTFSYALLDVSNGMILAQESSYYPLTKAIYSLLGRILPSAGSMACALGVVAMVALALTLGLATRLVPGPRGRLFSP